MMQFYECIYFFSSSYQRKNLSLVFPLIFNNKSLSGNKIKIGDLTITDGDLVSAMSINYALKYDFEVDVNSHFNANSSIRDVKAPIGGTVTIKAGKTSTNFTIKTVDDDKEEPTEKFLFTTTGYKYLGKKQKDNNLGSLFIMNGADGMIKDNEDKTPLQVEVSSQTIEVPIYDDLYKEPDETFYLTPVSSWGYSGNKEIEFVNAGEGTILDNDDNGQIVIEVGDSITIPAGVTSTTVTVAWGSDIVNAIVVDSDAPIEVSVTDFFYLMEDRINFIKKQYKIINNTIYSSLLAIISNNFSVICKKVA